MDNEDKIAAATLAAALIQIEASAAKGQTPINPKVAAARYFDCLDAITEKRRERAERPVYLDIETSAA